MSTKLTIIEGNSNDKDNVRTIMVKGEKGEMGDLNHNDIIDNLTSTATNKVLSAKQGKILKDLVDANKSDAEDTYATKVELNAEVTSRASADTTLQNNIDNETSARQDADTTLQSQILSLASGSPLVASSTSGMTDTTKVYVNTSDGKWYYYNGTSWVIGGTYQSTGIGDNSITYNNFDSLTGEHLEIYPVSYTLIDGSYISGIGAIITNQYSTSYSYSNPIELKKGETIVLQSSGTTNSVSMITTCDSLGAKRTVVAKSTTNNKERYSYTTDTDTYVIISGKTSDISNVYKLKDILTNNDLPKHLDEKVNSNDITFFINENTTFEENTYIRHLDGKTASLNNASASDYVVISPSAKIKIATFTGLNLVGNPDPCGLAFYDINKNFISGVQYPKATELEVTSPINAKYIRITNRNHGYNIYAYYENLSQVLKQNTIENSTPTDYLELWRSFRTVGIIGDSLASGECASNETGETKYHDIYEVSWGQFMARKSGNTYYNFSQGGMTTHSWLTNTNHGYPLASDGNHACDCYYIGLGENDYRFVDVGTSDDIDVNDFNNNADTFYGNYAGIIQRMKALYPKAKFFLFTMPSNANNRESYNVAIRYIANLFDNCYLLDLNEYYSTNYTSGSFNALNGRASHYNALAYQNMANDIALWTSKIMYENYEEFNQIEFINTEYSWS